MTTAELNAEVLRNLSIVAEDENLLKRVAKYLRRVVAEKQKDTTLMTEEEFFSRVEEAEEQYRQGQFTTLKPGESVEDMLKRSGYDV
jgi:hypothetical protein